MTNTTTSILSRRPRRPVLFTSTAVAVVAATGLVWGACSVPTGTAKSQAATSPTTSTTTTSDATVAAPSLVIPPRGATPSTLPSAGATRAAADATPCHPPTTGSVNPPLPPTANATPKLVFDHDPAMAWSIQLPAGWQPIQRDDSSLLAGNDASAPSVMLAVQAQYLPGDVCLGEFADWDRDALSANADIDPADVTATTVDSQPGAHWLTTAVENGTTVDVEVWWVIVDHVGYTAAAVWNPNADPRLVQAGRNTVGSFHVERGAQS